MWDDDISWKDRWMRVRGTYPEGITWAESEYIEEKRRQERELQRQKELEREFIPVDSATGIRLRDYVMGMDDYKEEENNNKLLLLL